MAAYPQSSHHRHRSSHPSCAAAWLPLPRRRPPGQGKAGSRRAGGDQQAHVPGRPAPSWVFGMHGCKWELTSWAATQPANSSAANRSADLLAHGRGVQHKVVHLHLPRLQNKQHQGVSSKDLGGQGMLSGRHPVIYRLRTGNTSLALPPGVPWCPTCTRGRKASAWQTAATISRPYCFFMLTPRPEMLISIRDS